MIDENLLLEIVDNQEWAFPLQTPLVLDCKLVPSKKLQSYLRVTQYINQDGKCVCNGELGNDMELHHALITKEDVKGIKEKDFIHHTYNTILLHHDCHIKIRRYVSMVYLVKHYGLNEVQTWYQNSKGFMKDGGFRNLEGLQ